MFLGSSQLSLKRDEHNIYNRNQKSYSGAIGCTRSYMNCNYDYFGQLRFDTFKYDKFNNFYSNKKRI